MAQSKKAKRDAAKARAKQRARNQGKDSKSQNLRAQLGNLQTGLMNMRQLYDQVTQEKQTLQAEIIRRDQLITALAAEYDGLSVHKVTLEQVGAEGFVGYEQELEDDEMFIIAIHKDDLEEDDVDTETTEEVEETDEG